MIRFTQTIFILLFALFATGCNDHPAPSEDEVKSFFLQSSTIAPMYKEGRLKVTTFKITKDKSRKVAEQEFYRAEFAAEVSIVPAECLQQTETDCADAAKAQEMTGTAEYEWDGDGWSKAGIIFNQ